MNDYPKPRSKLLLAMSDYFLSHSSKIRGFILLYSGAITPPLQVAEGGVLIKGYVLMFTLYDGMSRGICSGHRLRGIQEKEGGGK